MKDDFSFSVLHTNYNEPNMEAKIIRIAYVPYASDASMKAIPDWYPHCEEKKLV